MRAVLIHFKDKNNQEVIETVEVMHYSTALEKLRYSLDKKVIELMIGEYPDIIGKKLESKAKVNKTTYVTRDNMYGVLANVGLGEFEYALIPCIGISAVITITASYKSRTEEFYIVCGSKLSGDEEIQKVINRIEELNKYVA